MTPSRHKKKRGLYNLYRAPQRAYSCLQSSVYSSEENVGHISITFLFFWRASWLRAAPRSTERKRCRALRCGTQYKLRPILYSDIIMEAIYIDTNKKLRHYVNNNRKRERAFITSSSTHCDRNAAVLYYILSGSILILSPFKK